MEPNTGTSSAAAAGTSTAATADDIKDLTPEQVQKLYALLLTPVAMPSLLSASDHRHLLSWYRQKLMIPSPLPAVGRGGSVVPAAVHAHASSSSSSQQGPSTSMFPAVSELPTMADDIFAGLEPLAASTNPVVPTMLGVGDQPGQEGLVQPSPAWTAAPGLPLPQSPSEGVLGFAAGQPAASTGESDMPIYSPSFSSSDQLLPLPQSSDADDMVGIIPQPSSDYEMAPLPASLCIPSLPEVCCGSSMDGFGSSVSSVPDLTTGAMNPPAPMLPLTIPASSQGAGASSNFIAGLGEPSSFSESELAAAVPGLQQVPPVKVKQEPVDATTATLRDPEFISLVDDGDEDELDLEALLSSFPDLEGLLPMLDTSCSEVGGLSSETTVVALPEKNATISTMGSSGCAAQSTHCHDGNVSMGVDTSSSTAKVSIAAKQTSGLPPLAPSSKGAGASSNRRYATIGMSLFTEAEMEILMKDKQLQQLWIADPKRVKRIVYNRMSAAKAKARMVNHTMDLERRVETLEIKRKTLCEQLQSLKDGTSELKSQHTEMMMKRRSWKSRQN